MTEPQPPEVPSGDQLPPLANPYAQPPAGATPPPAYGQQPPPYAPPDQYGQPQSPPAYGQPQYGQPAQYGQPPQQYPPTPYGQPYGQPYGYPGQSRGTNGMAIASMVLGILWLYWIGSILALIFGYIARKQMKANPQGGDGMAIAGIVLGWIGVAILVVVIIAVAASN